MYDAIVFDLDGTLWDASKSSTIGWNNGLKSLNIDRSITVDDMKSVTGKPIQECLRILFPRELSRHPSLLTVLSQYEEDSIKNSGGELFDQLHGTIQYLSKKVDLFLVSNCQQWYLEVFLASSGLQQHFKGINCNGISNKSKYEMLVQFKENYQFRNPLYVGDTEGDEMSAKKAGYAFAFARYGFGQAKEPDISIKSFADLMAVI
ncbi:MAG TPA: HAD family hydrolase [Clostridiales bacterium]|jgi:phosphoglycolate phosphatase|nr:HAD family hydrolase [Bacillota bacterium]HCS73383.1 HAD family hydrolase [Clostridiales bacterium]